MCRLSSFRIDISWKLYELHTMIFVRILPKSYGTSTGGISHFRTRINGNGGAKLINLGSPSSTDRPRRLRQRTVRHRIILCIGSFQPPSMMHAFTVNEDPAQLSQGNNEHLYEKLTLAGFHSSRCTGDLWERPVESSGCVEGRVTEQELQHSASQRTFSRPALDRAQQSSPCASLQCYKFVGFEVSVCEVSVCELAFECTRGE